MSTRALYLLLALLPLWSCGADQGSNIVGLMINPASATASIGSGADFAAALQYVDGHQRPVSNVTWSIQGKASLIFGTSSSDVVTVQCVRPSDYFAGGYVGDTITGSVEFGGQTYIGTASLVCR